MGGTKTPLSRAASSHTDYLGLSTELKILQLYIILSKGGVVTGWSALRIPVTVFLYSKMSRPALRPTQPPTQGEPRFFPGDKAAGT
jgi:hypothetical protein